MHELDDNAAPELDTLPAPGPQQEMPRWRQPPMRIGIVIVLCLLALLAWKTTRPTPHVDVFGTLTLAADASQTDGTSCTGTGGYSDIAPGIAVVIGGPSGQTLAVGSLGEGIEAQGECVFAFDVQAPAGLSLYTVTISHRGTQTLTPAQAADGIALTLG